MEDATRNVYRNIAARHVLRTEDVYQTFTDDGVVGYSDTLLSVVAHFHNAGAPQGYNAQSMVGKSKRGEVAVRLFACIDDTDKHMPRITRVGFKARGCLAMTGCASMVCSLLEGSTFEQALSIDVDDVKKALDGVPADKSYTAYFATEAIRALIGDYWINQGKDLAYLDKYLTCNTVGVACILCEHCSLRTTRLELSMAKPCS